MRRVIVIALALGLLAAACKGDKAPTASSGPPATPTDEVITGPPGSFQYEAYGVTASMEKDGDAWSLKVENRTGDDLGVPDVYALDARDGQRVEGEVDPADSLPNNQSMDYTVTFPDGFDVANETGLMELTLGGANWGAFVHVSDTGGQ